MRGQMYCLNCEPTESDGTPTGQPCIVLHWNLRTKIITNSLPVSQFQSPNLISDFKVRLIS